MIYPEIPLAQSIIEICQAKGLTHIVISPGSRNAPLTIGFVNRTDFKCFSIADERCAAFFALGMAQQMQKPVALVCTSGSALLNYYPAFAEAFYSQIPLVVISADRPLDKIDIGDGQTIRQQNVFENHSLYNANLSEEASALNDFKINEAIAIAIAKKGPVHINAPFEEPLYKTVESLAVNIQITENHNEDFDFNSNALEEFITLWNSVTKKMILVGVNYPHCISEENIKKIASDNSVIVLTETTSNLHHPTFISTIDTFITPFEPADFESFQPEILITFGGMVVSKRIKAFLRKYKPRHHWHIDTLRAYDTFGALSQHFKTEPNTFFNALLPNTKQTISDYFDRGQMVNALRNKKQKAYLEKISFSDFKVFEAVLSSLPKHSHLQISNSSAIRYAQLIAIDPSVEIYSNRGTSGIDGSTSTAIGAAFASEKPTIFITGDIGFFYDSNALWNKYIPKNFKIIMINNGGGGIFRILPGHAETSVFNEFFETSHCYTAEHLAKMYGFEYRTASTVESLQLGLEVMYRCNDKPFFLEVFTPTLENDKILLQFFRELT